MQVTLELPATVTFKRAGHNVTYNLAALPPTVLADLCAHGLTQKVGDSAAGKEGQEALSKMDMTYAALADGKWSLRGEARAATVKDLRATTWQDVVLYFAGAAAAKPPKGVKVAEHAKALWATYPEKRRARILDEVEHRLAMLAEDDEDVDVDGEPPLFDALDAPDATE